jgi:hypothetical protein
MPGGEGTALSPSLAAAADVAATAGVLAEGDDVISTGSPVGLPSSSAAHTG